MPASIIVYVARIGALEEIAKNTAHVPLAGGRFPYAHPFIGEDAREEHVVEKRACCPGRGGKEVEGVRRLAAPRHDRLSALGDRAHPSSAVLRTSWYLNSPS